MFRFPSAAGSGIVAIIEAAEHETDVRIGDPPVAGREAARGTGDRPGQERA